MMTSECYSGSIDRSRTAKLTTLCRLTRMLMSRMLTRLGHHVTTAENGKIASEMIKDMIENKEGSVKFDIVFLDK